MEKYDSLCVGVYNPKITMRSNDIRPLDFNMFPVKQEAKLCISVVPLKKNFLETYSEVPLVVFTA